MKSATPAVKPIFDKVILKKVQFDIRAILHPLRARMLEIIKRKGQVIVTDMFIEMRLEQSVVSQHLAILRGAGVVETKRDGKHIHYSLNEARIAKLTSLINEF